MQNKILALFLLSFITIVVSACNGESSKIGVINEEKIFVESDAAKAGNAYIEALSAKLMPKFVELQAQLQKDPNNIVLKEDLEKQAYDIQEQFTAERQRVLDKINEKYTAVKEKYRKDAGLTILFLSQAAISFDSTVDVTDAIIAEMNKSPVDFTVAVTTPEANSTAKLTVSNGTMMKSTPSANATAK